jgi:hypothetical protein
MDPSPGSNHRQSVVEAASASSVVMPQRNRNEAHYKQHEVRFGSSRTLLGYSCASQTLRHHINTIGIARGILPCWGNM